MQSAYSMAKAELEKIRTKNRNASADRWRVVISKNPRIGEIRQELKQCGTALLRCVLEKNGRFEEIKSQIKKLQAEKYSILAENNLPEDFLDDIYDCEICHDTGNANGEVCVCMKRLIREAVCRKSNLTEKMQSQTFENYDHSLFGDEKTLRVMEKVFEYCVRFAEQFDKTHENLLLTGGAGTGKTYISSCIANRAVERGFSVYYQSAYRLFEIAEQVKFGRSTDDEPEIMKYVYDADLLIIDDLGTEFISAFSTSAFFDIINERLLSRKSTVLSTNLDMNALDEIYSHRITSRFAGEYQVVQTIGKDLRIK